MRRAVVAGLVVAAVAVPWWAAAQGGRAPGYVPPAGFVPDSLTAVRIAVAVWSPIFGERQIASEAPYVAALHDGVWTVTGTLNCPASGECMGGTAQAEIVQHDARILRVGHTQ